MGNPVSPKRAPADRLTEDALIPTPRQADESCRAGLRATAEAPDALPGDEIVPTPE
jgi:hypothetical protein